MSKIKVLVKFTTQVVYSKEVEMTRREFEFHNEMLDRAREDRESREYEQDMFDEFGFQLSDANDYDDPELDTFEEVEP